MAKARQQKLGSKGVNTVRPIIVKQTQNGTKKQERTSTAVAANTGMKGGMRKRNTNTRSR